MKSKIVIAIILMIIGNLFVSTKGEASLSNKTTFCYEVQVRVKCSSDSKDLTLQEIIHKEKESGIEEPETEPIKNFKSLLELSGTQETKAGLSGISIVAVMLAAAFIVRVKQKSIYK